MDNIKILRALKAKAEKQLQLTLQEIEVYERKIQEAETTGAKIKPPKANAIDAEFFIDFIQRLLKDHDTGLTTKYAHHLAEVFTKREINYNTFRSYLNRMKNKGLIELRNNKWHLKI